MQTKKRFLFIEPFFGGSHKDFAEGLISHTRHEISLVTLPSRFWKWRMRGAALYLHKHLPPFSSFDGLIVSDLMSLSDLKAIRESNFIPSLVYFHENQLTYPLAPGETMDYQFGFTDITTAVCADRLVFNSITHRQQFLDHLPTFIGRMPEYKPHWVVAAIRKKSNVLYPGCHIRNQEQLRKPELKKPPLIIWNHRWEFDKNPLEFFDALYAVQKKGTDFRVALLGECFQAVPKPFIRARKHLGNRLIHYGYIRSRDDYMDMLRTGAIVISTSQQENFGISVVEAVGLGCLPLLPDRLSYPEILPNRYHSQFLYSGFDDLVSKLDNIINNYSHFIQYRSDLSAEMACYSWENLIAAYDNCLDKLTTMGRSV